MKRLDSGFRVWLIAALVGVALTVGASLVVNHFSEQDPQVDAGEAVSAMILLTTQGGTPLEGGVATYRDRGWQDLGVTDGLGQIHFGADAGEYPFRLTFRDATVSKDHHIGQDPVVRFETILVHAKVVDEGGNPVPDTEIRYHSVDWNAFGVTDSEGICELDLMPGQYTFRALPGDKQYTQVQDIEADPVVVFTVKSKEQSSGVAVRLVDSHGQPLSGGAVKWHDGSWHDGGATDGNGRAQLAIGEGEYTFQVEYAGGKVSRRQHVSPGSEVLFETIAVTVRLQDSNGSGLADGATKYHMWTWKEFGTTDGSGDVVRELLPGQYTFQMEYAGGRVSKVQNVADDQLVLFETVAVTVRLQDSNGGGLADGVSKYHMWTWKEFGTTDGSGDVVRELLPCQYTFQMEYAGGRVSKVQNVADDQLVLFETVAVTVRLQDSNGGGLADGATKYHMWTWKEFGATDGSGNVVRELLPCQYTFQMEYAGGRVSKVQNVANDQLVLFQTVAVTVRLQDSNGGGLADGATKYHMWTWKEFGTTDGSGDVVRELLPCQYTFQMEYAGGRVSKVQNVADDQLVLFQTVAVTVRLQDSNGGGLADGATKYHMWTWKDFGTTDGSGDVVRELLPCQYTFQMEYAGGRVSKVQNVSSDPLVLFQTILVTVQVNDQDGQAVSGAECRYHSWTWKTIGTTGATGSLTAELLPIQYTFSAKVDGQTDSKRQNVTADPLVLFGAETRIVADLNLTSMCSNDPKATRRWRVRNPNAFAVQVRWQAYGTNQTDTYMADPGDTYFETNAVGGANTTKLYWRDHTGTEKSKTKASGASTCVTNPVLGLSKTADRSTALVGESVLYTLVVANDGDMILHNVTLSDPMLGIDENIGELAVGASVTRFGTYGPISESDMPGPLKNTATADCDETDTVQDSASVTLLKPADATPQETPTPDPKSGADTAPPTVEIQTPGSRDLVSGQVDILGAAEDETCLADAALLINGQLVADGVPYTWDTTSAGDGWHEITLTAEDCAGNQAETSIQVEVDNTAPIPPQLLAADTPGLGGPVNQILLGGLAEDNARLQLWFKAPEATEFALSQSLFADDCGQWETLFEFELIGEYVFKMSSQDLAGNWAWGNEFALSLDVGAQLSTLVVQQGRDGYDGTTDTWLSSWAPEANYGIDTDAHVRGGSDTGMLLRYSLDEVLPAAYHVQNASLGVYSTEQSNANPLALGVFAMGRAWSEDEASFQQADDNTDWDEPGANGALDREMMPSSGAWAIDAETWTVFDVTAMAQGWVADPADNNGLLIKGSGETSVDYSFASSEYPAECRRPALYVIYSSAEPMMLMD